MSKKLYVSDSSTNYLDLPGAVAYFNLSASTIKNLARKSGAKMKIGSSARYRKDILADYIESLQEERKA